MATHMAAMGKCERSCEENKHCPETGECCHSCLYYVNSRCITTGGNYYYPRHFKRLAVAC